MQEINNNWYVPGCFVETDTKPGDSTEYVNKIKKSNPKQLAKDHWSYIEGLLSTHGVSQEDVGIIGFHYRTAFEHGYKHAMEDK